MKFLIVDDNPDHRELSIRRLRRAFPDAAFTEVVRLGDLEKALQEGDFDLVLTDYRLNWSDGLKVQAMVRAAMPHVPVVMVTDTGSEEIAAEGMKAGLSDYVLKDHLHRLPLAAKESLEKARLQREHEAALEALRLSEERYRAVSELSSDYAYSFRVESDGTLVREWITQAFTRITGYDPAELDSGVLMKLAHPQDRAVLAEGRERLRAGEPFSCEIRILTRDGEVRWLRDSARPAWDDARRRVIRIYGAGQDITDRKRAEEERAQFIREQAARAVLEASERRYRSLAEAIPQIVWTARPDGFVEFYNSRWFEYTGLSPAEAYAPEGWALAMHPDDVDRCRARWRQALASGEPYEDEYRFRRASDQTFRCHLVRAVPLRDAEGRVQAWFGSSTDIDDRKHQEESLRQAQKLESIGLLAGGVAHDFNNLLTGILGNATLALEELPADSSARPMLDDVILATERAADLTRQLLAYSGKGRFFVQPLNVADLVQQTAKLIQSSIPKKVRISFELAPDLPLVEGDATQLQQLLMNLVINGAEAIGEDRTGTVSVVTGWRFIDPEFIRGHRFAVDGIPPGRYVVLQVRDDGCGMDPEVQAHIFDPFYTTKFTGRGLGLSAALGIVRGHNGAIRFESAPGAGTTFEVLLPAAVAHEPAPAAEETDSTDLRGSGTILVVDDEEVVRRAVCSTLERLGYTVVLAENGERAMEIFDRIASRVSLVLLDLTMPVMSGAETLAALRRIAPEIPVIATSGYSETVALERFAGQGVAGFLQKPFTSHTLGQKIKELLSDPVGQAQGQSNQV